MYYSAIMRGLLSTIVTALLLLVAVAAGAAIDTSEPFKVAWSREGAAVASGGDFEFKITIRASEGYYLYAGETDVDFASLEGLFVTELLYPEPEAFADPFLHKSVLVYSGDVVISIKGRVPEGLGMGPRELTAVLRYQGCSPTLCFRPKEREMVFTVDVVPIATAGREARVGGGETPRKPFSIAWVRGIFLITLVAGLVITGVFFYINYR